MARTEGVWKGVFEQPCQVWVLQLEFHVGNDFLKGPLIGFFVFLYIKAETMVYLDNTAIECSACRRWAHKGQPQRPGGKGAMRILIVMLIAS